MTENRDYSTQARFATPKKSIDGSLANRLQFLKSISKMERVFHLLVETMPPRKFPGISL